MPGSDTRIADRAEAILEPLKITQRQEIRATIAVTRAAKDPQDYADLIDALGLNHRKMRSWVKKRYRGKE